MRNNRFTREQWLEHRRKNRMFFGIGIAVVGILLMLKTLGILSWFSMEFSWPIILIVFGVLMGVKSNFRHSVWWVLILVGVANLTPQFTIFGHPSRRLVWPAFMILGGLAIALRPRRKYCDPHPGPINTSINTDGNIDIDVTFGGRKEIVTSKDFKGGAVSVTFAGCELNLTQADFSGPSVIIDFRVSFSGVELIVPSHWDIQNEVNPSFGNVEDARTIQTATSNETRKTLILRGNCSFGNIEIKSY